MGNVKEDLSSDSQHSWQSQVQRHLSVGPELAGEEVGARGCQGLVATNVAETVSSRFIEKSRLKNWNEKQ